MQRKWMIGISIVVLSYLWTGTLSAQNEQPSERGPRIPLGIYAKDDISIDIANLKSDKQATDPASLNDYFINLYQLVLKERAVSGLEIQIHWDTVNPNPPGTPPADSPCVVALEDAAGQASQDKPGQSPDGTNQ
jgi:hypothetical protein